MEDSLTVGSRVFVQFGRKKYYTGIVESIHNERPEGYDVRDIVMVLDPIPVVRYPQLKFWSWISDYYLCSIGEVYKAAVPSGLKLESETCVEINPESEVIDGLLTEREAMIYAHLSHNGKSALGEIEKELDLRQTPTLVNRMLDKGVLIVSEKIVDRYRPMRQTFVRINAEREDGDTLHGFFDKVSRSHKQEKALLAYLTLSQWHLPGNELREVERKDLIETAQVSPAIIKALVDKGIFEIYKRTTNRFGNSSSLPTEISLPALSDPQNTAFREICESFRDHKVALLHGVTGSGKTEIYAHLIKNVLDGGRSVLYLVPEISLTTQLTDRLRRMFGDHLIVYHSKFSDNERVDIWTKLRTSHTPMLVLGVRSSLFLPFDNLGLIVVDEEHEASFKQYDPAPRYHARDAAIVLASLHGAKTLLGSATPDISTYYKALHGKYGLVTLTQRYEDASMPEVEIVDMRKQRKEGLNTGILSRPLDDKVRDALARGKQILMFQNRRGFSPMVVCNDCGWTPRCVNCDVSLVYHKMSHQLRCHYCGYSTPLPSICPACGSNAIATYGYGTERIAEDLHRHYEGARVARMDLDTTRNKDSYHEIIAEFSKGDTDILVGTQMISKGLDFANVTTVGVLNADTLLNYPDFRSNERAFNMLEQVAGRAGRRQDLGNVIIQTTDPENPVLARVKAHDYAAFYNEEIEQRRLYSYPPFTRIVNIYFRHRDESTVDSVAVAYTNVLIDIFGNRVLGPEKPFVSRVANYYLQKIMLKIEAGASMQKVKRILRDVYERMSTDPRMKQTYIHYDVDPV